MKQQEEKKLVSPAGIEYGFSGAENLQTATKLKEGITCKVTGVQVLHGNKTARYKNIVRKVFQT